MVVVSYSGKEINAKLVYYGAGLSGKTTNLESIYEAVPDTSRGKMVSMKTQSDRTLFFDLLPLDLGEIMGFKTRFLLYTVPGQVFYNATRKLVLKGADAIVFVADSEVGKMEENKESLANLRGNLSEYGIALDDLPWVIQYNKRDLPNVYSVEELNAELNPDGRVPWYEAVATTGKGVFETFRGVSHLLMERVTRDLRRTPTATGASRSSGAEAPAARSAPGAAAPVAPSRAIAQEAQQAAGRATGVPAGLDYGREIDLPGEPPAPPKKSAAPAPVEPALTGRTSPAGPAAARSKPGATAPVAVVSMEAVPETVGADDGAPAAQAVAVPIVIPKSGVHEIVVRIVLKVEG